MLEVQIRPATADDLNLVRKSWMRSYRKARAMEWVSNDAYDAGMSSRIESILADARVRVVVASPPGDTLTAFGFIVAGPQTLHYVWTKEAWRRQGVARQLVTDAFPAGIPNLSHVTRMGEGIWHDRIPSARYDPFGIP